MNLILPFTLRSDDRVKRFSKDMEQATIFCLTEIGRNKGGLIRRRPPEKIVFIAEVCYPIWAVPWGKVTLLFDGLGLRKYPASFGVLPDTNVFMKEVKANTGETGTYLDFLTHNVNYFQGFAGTGKKVIDGLIADPAFLRDFEPYLSKAKRVRGPMPDKLILTPFVDRVAVESSVNGLSKLKSDLETDVKKINKIAKMLTRLTDKHVKLLMNKNEVILQEAEQEISQTRAQDFKKTEEMRRGYDKKILELQKQAEKKIHGLWKTHEEIEKRKAELTEYAQKCETEIYKCKEHEGEDVALDFWETELEKSRDEMSEIDREVSEVETSINAIEQSRNVEISQVEAEFDARSKALISDLKRIENTRDSKIALNEDRIKALKDSSSAFIAHISRLSDLRRSAVANLETIGLPRVRRKFVEIYVPFYLACYKQEFKRRYALFPPSLAHGMRGVTKFKGVFRSSKVTVVLDGMSEAITRFLNLFILLVEQNPIFEEKLFKAGTKVNLLGAKESRQEVAKGLERLSAEGWLYENVLRSFKKKLAKA
ncbi:MAG: hypothetical protein NWF14_09900 [Candidatus Bathyarchaeota archaeon]|nr:hypothetical protein [Candidatus Bathyarchaeota archaeon]